MSLAPCGIILVVLGHPHSKLESVCIDNFSDSLVLVLNFQLVHSLFGLEIVLCEDLGILSLLGFHHFSKGGDMSYICFVSFFADRLPDLGLFSVTSFR